MLIVTIDGRVVSGPVPPARATALARSYVQSWGILRDRIAFASPVPPPTTPCPCRICRP